MSADDNSEADLNSVLSGDDTPGEGDGKAGQSLLDLADKGGDDGDQGAAGTGDGDDGTDEPKPFHVKDRPEFLPEQFHDKDSGEVRIESLVKSWKDGQDVIANRVKELPDDAIKAAGLMKVPEGAVSEPTGYEVAIAADLAESSKRVLVPSEELGGEDVMVHRFRDVAAKHRMSGAAFNDCINFYIKESVAVLPAPIDQKAEMAKLGPQAQNVLNATNGFGEALKAQGLIDDAAFEEYRLCCASAPGVLMIQAIRDYYGEKPIPVQMQQAAVNAADAGALRAEQAEIVQLAQDGKIDDREAQRRYDLLQDKYRKHFGEDAAGSSMVEATQ